MIRIALFSALIGAISAAGTALAANAQSPAAYRPELAQSGKDVVWVPTPDALVNRMLDLAKVSASDQVLDLGSGDGRLVIMAAKRGARAHGIEYDEKLVAYSRQLAKQAGVADRVTFVKADLFDSDFSQATVVTLFLGPDLNRKLIPKLLNLHPGTRIVSNTHPIGDWPADDTAESTDDEKSVYYRKALLWVVPAKVGGVWQSPAGRVTLAQRYQMLSGTLSAQGKSAPLMDANLHGNQIRFSVGGARYTGTASGDTITGAVISEGVSRQWSATRAR